MKNHKPKVILAGGTILLLMSSFVVLMNGLTNAEAQEEESSEVSVASGSNRFVVWADNTPGNTDVFFRRSTDNGATWMTIVNLSKNSGTSVQPKIFVIGSNVYVAWVQSNSEGTSDDIFFRRSLDNGVSWGSKVKITQSGKVGYTLSGIAGSGNYVYLN